LLSFFSAFQTAVGVLSFLLQSGVSEPALERMGIGGTMALLPVSVAGLGILALAMPSLLTTALQRGADGVMRASFFRSAYEVLFTPIPPSAKRATKTVIDVAFDRAGLLLGSGVTLALVGIWPESGVRLVTAAAVVASAAQLVLAYRVQRGYAETLAQRLRSGVLRIDLGDIRDATTRKTASQTLSELDRSTLLAQLEAVRSARSRSESREPLRDTQEPSNALARAMNELQSDDPYTVRAALARDDVGHPLLAPPLLALLARDELSRDVMRVLSPIASRIVGAVSDMLLDEGQPPRARSRAARLLGSVGDERSSQALVLGLDVSSFEVRYACGRALVEVCARDASLSFDAIAMFARARREIESQLEDARSIEHTFNVLSLAFPHESIQLAYGALQSADAALQGVALEYLEVVLPAELRAVVMPRLARPSQRPAAPRPSTRSLDDLLRSREMIRSQLEELRRLRDPDSDPT
jgi:hypothetical protein